MKSKTLTLELDQAFGAYRCSNILFICTRPVLRALGKTPTSLKLRISRWKPARAKHWMQVEIGPRQEPIALAQSPSLTEYIQSYDWLPSYPSFRDFVNSYPHPIYISLIS